MLVPISFATSINLLAAMEGEDVGNVIKASLTTQDGSGKVFMENNLISNPDTQVSVKIAHEIICSNYFDCSNLDFFYTIHSGSSIITGPSGGAGLSLLTYSHLLGKQVSNNYAISGTINSGGYIGNVGGLKEKIRAASYRGIHKVMIPFANAKSIDFSEVNLTNSSLNMSDLPKVDLVSFGKSLGVTVIPTSSFDDVLEEVFNIPKINYTIVKPEFYSQIMGDISDGICSISSSLNNTSDYSLGADFKSYYCFNSSNCSLPKMDEFSYSLYTNFSTYLSSANNLLNYSSIAQSAGDYYASASYCFGANINLRYMQFLSLSLNESISKANGSINLANDVLRSDLKTLNDLQVYSVVKERILDATKSFNEALNLSDSGKILEAIDKLSYSYERAYTALSWSKFYDVPDSTKITGSLKDACSLALSDSNSRVQYIKLYLSIPLEAESTLDKAKESQSSGDYPMCIYYSLESKAEAEIVSSIIGADSEQIASILEAKQEIATKFIAKQYAEGNYPLLGYSYLEYGSSLKENNPYSSLLYFQMAQELSNLDIFLETDSIATSVSSSLHFSSREWFLSGLIVGLILATLTFRFESKLKKLLKK